MENPLLDFSGLPRFAAIRPEHVVPAIESLVAEGRAAIERLAATGEEPTWAGFVEPLENANERYLTSSILRWIRSVPTSNLYR